MHPSLPSISGTFFHLEKLKLYPFNNSISCPFAPVLGNHHYTFCLHECHCSGYFVLSGLIKYLYFCDWLISLNIMSSKFIDVVAYCRIPFLKLIFFCMYIPHFVYPFICWWLLGLLPPLTNVNNVPMNMGIQIPWQVPAFNLFGIISQKRNCW